MDEFKLQNLPLKHKNVRKSSMVGRLEKLFSAHSCFSTRFVGCGVCRVDNTEDSGDFDKIFGEVYTKLFDPCANLRWA